MEDENVNEEDIVTVDIIIPGILTDDVDVIDGESFVIPPIVGYDETDNPIYADPDLKDPIGETFPEAVIPDVPTIYLDRCALDVYLNADNVSKIKSITVTWNQSTGAEYYQVFLIEDSNTSLKYDVKEEEFGGYADGPLFSQQSGPITETEYTFKPSSTPKRINAFVFAYSQLGRSSFPVTMVTFLAADKVNYPINNIYLERTSYVYKPDVCFNFDDGSQDLGTATQNLAFYKAGVNVVTALARPSSPIFRFNNCKTRVNRPNSEIGDFYGVFIDIVISWKPVEDARSYQVFLSTGHNELQGDSPINDSTYDMTRTNEAYTNGPLFFYQSGLLDGSITEFTYTFDSETSKVSAFVFAYNELGRSDYPTLMLSANSFVPEMQVGLIAIERTRYVSSAGILKTTDGGLADFNAGDLNVLISEAL